MTDDLNRLRAVTLTDEEMDSILNADSRSHMFRRIESIIAARTAALLDRAERAEAERRDHCQRAFCAYFDASQKSQADLAALRAAVTNLADEYTPTIKRQLECVDVAHCACTFCEFIDDLLTVVQSVQEQTK